MCVEVEYVNDKGLPIPRLLLRTTRPFPLCFVNHHPHPFFINILTFVLTKQQLLNNPLIALD